MTDNNLIEDSFVVSFPVINLVLDTLPLLGSFFAVEGSATVEN